MKNYLTMSNIPQDNKKSKQQGINPLYEILRADGSIVVNKALVHAIGLHEAILFAELISRFNYFAEREQLTGDGYFFNTVIDLQAATCLSRKQQKNALNRLEELQLIYTRLQGMPAKRYFKIADNMAMLSKYIQQGKELMKELKDYKEAEKPRELKIGNNGRTSTAESAEQDRPKGTSNNTNVNDTKKEREQPEKNPAPSIDTSKEKKPKSAVNELIGYYINLYRERFGHDYPVSKNQDHGIIKNLVNEHGLEMVREILKEHVNTKDKWILERGCALTTINNSLPEYLARINKARAEEEAEQQRRENARQRQEEIQRQEEEAARQRAEWEALPEVEKVKIELDNHRGKMETLKPIREKAAANGDQEATQKLKEYDQKEAELLQRLREAETKENTG